MEREAFFSGYCRCIDAARTVAVEAEGKALTEVDCLFTSCPHAHDCPIGQKIKEFLEQQIIDN